tara:strand:+ start:883 stop:1779 length:897 start_codon:yes stop_codon:yes gene_type:complete
MTSKTRLNSHLKKKEIKEKIEVLQTELIELQTLTGNELENYYMKVKNLDDDALTVFWKPKQASINAQEGKMMIQAAIDGYKNVLEMLTKAYNGVQSANDTFTDTEWTELSDELNELIAGIKTVARFTEYNGTHLIDGNYKSSNRENAATFLVGIKPTDTVTYTPVNMNPGVLGELSLSEVILADDETTELDTVVLEHFARGGHSDTNGDNLVVTIDSIETATIALNSISGAITQVKDTLTDASLTVQELDRIRGFMEAKYNKGAEFLSNFKNERAQDVATELENLNNQLELIISMSEF